ncbi:MAG: cell division protein FtsZ [Alphaproteobacteria bacterium]
MTINLKLPRKAPDLKPRIAVVGVGGAGGNAVNNMVKCQLEGVEFVACNTDAQALSVSVAERKIQLGRNITQGLGAGSRPDVGRAAAEEAIDEIIEHLQGSSMVFITAGMGGGTGTGAAPVIARAAREQGILTVGVVTKPFQFEGLNRMRVAEAGLEELQLYVDTLIIIPNQNLFRVANEQTTFAEAFKMADHVLYSGVRGVTDLMVMPGLINLDFADIRQVMSEMGRAMMGTGEAEGDKRALDAAEEAISNPLLEDISMQGARGALINITGGLDMTLFEVDEAANRIRDEVDADANMIFGSTFDEGLEGRMRISLIATGIDAETQAASRAAVLSLVSNSARPEALPEEADRAAPEAVSPAAEPSLEIPEILPANEAASDPGDAQARGAAVATSTQEAPDVQTQEAAPAAAPEGASHAQGDEPFLPPPPAESESQSEAAAAAEPFAAAAMANGGGQRGKKRRRSRNLFERMARAGRAARHAKAEAVDRPADSAPEPAAQPAPEATPGPGAPPSARPNPGAVAAPALRPAGPKLGEPGSAATPNRPGIEEDLLDIPAFLRRQAN